MGLHAVVFRNVQNLEKSFGHGLFEVDESTGEGMLKPSAELIIPRTAYFATKKQLGNLAEIGVLRGTITTILSAQNSLIMNRVLYSGSHSGDAIVLEEMRQLREELELLKTQNKADLREFIESMESLLAAADAEQNPIVFV